MAANKADMDFLLNQATIKVPGASSAGLKLELFDVFREFFTDTNAWMEDIPVSIVPATITYALTPSEGAIVRLAGVVDVNMIPQPAIMPTIGTLLFREPYAQAQTFTATVVKTCALPIGKTDMLTVVPDWLLPIWSVGILDGLMGKMMAQMGKSYSNQKQSNYHLARFRDAIQRARTAALRRNTIGSQAWSYPQGFRTRGQKGGISVGNTSTFQ